MFEVSLKGQVCLITGATRGIGKAVALTMAKADLMGLVIVDIQKDAVAEETQKELQSMGVDVKFVTGDASSEDVIKEAVKVCVDNWGKIDILANIAGVSYMRGLEDTTVEQWDKVMAINLRSTFLTMKYCSEVMKNRDMEVLSIHHPLPELPEEIQDQIMELPKLELSLLQSLLQRNLVSIT